MEPIKIQFTLTAADCRRASLALLRSTMDRGWLMFALMFVVFPILAFAYLLSLGQGPSLSALIMPLAGITIPALSVWAGHRAFLNMPEFQKQLSMEFSEAGFQFSDQKQHVSLDWEAYGRWDVVLGTLFLIAKAGNRTAIPTRAFTDAQRKDLVALLNRRLGAAKPRPWWRRSILWVVLVLVFVAIYNVISGK